MDTHELAEHLIKLPKVPVVISILEKNERESVCFVKSTNITISLLKDYYEKDGLPQRGEVCLIDGE